MTEDEEFSIGVSPLRSAFETPEIKAILSSFRLG
jgi:hypothetical protein